MPSLLRGGFFQSYKKTSALKSALYLLVLVQYYLIPIETL